LKDSIINQLNRIVSIIFLGLKNYVVVFRILIFSLLLLVYCARAYTQNPKIKCTISEKYDPASKKTIRTTNELCLLADNKNDVSFNLIREVYNNCDTSYKILLYWERRTKVREEDLQTAYVDTNQHLCILLDSGINQKYTFQSKITCTYRYYESVYEFLYRFNDMPLYISKKQIEELMKYNLKSVAIEVFMPVRGRIGMRSVIAIDKYFYRFRLAYNSINQ